MSAKELFNNGKKFVPSLSISELNDAINGAPIYKDGSYTSGKDVNGSGVETNLGEACITDYIPVQQGNVYNLKNIFHYTYSGCLYDSAKNPISGVVIDGLAVNTIGNGSTTIPDGVAYIRLNTQLIHISELEVIAKKDDGAVRFEKLRVSQSQIDGNAESINSADIVFKPFAIGEGKVLLAFGDSITAGVASSSPFPHANNGFSYIETIARNFGLTSAELKNKAVSGSCATFLEGSDRVVLINSVNNAKNTLGAIEPDTIIVMIGINDHHQNRDVGAWGDTTNETFYGGIYEVASKLDEYWANAKKIWVTPINFVGVESNKYPLSAYRSAIKQTAIYFGHSLINGDKIPFPTGNGMWSSLLMADNLHPTKLGHGLLAHYICGLIG